jgi:hypothetical protein
MNLYANLNRVHNLKLKSHKHVIAGVGEREIGRKHSHWYLDEGIKELVEVKRIEDEGEVLNSVVMEKEEECEWVGWDSMKFMKFTRRKERLLF